MKEKITVILCSVLFFLLTGCPGGVSGPDNAGTISGAKSITSFSFTSPVRTGIINESTHTIAVAVPTGTDVTALVPTITHTGTSISPATGVAQNFTGEMTYTVTAEDNSTQAYVVTVTAVEIEIYGYWTLTGPDFTLNFTNSAMIGIDVDMAGSIIEFDNVQNTCVMQITQYMDPSSVGKYQKMSWNDALTEISGYDICDTLEAARNSTIILGTTPMQRPSKNAWPLTAANGSEMVTLYWSDPLAPDVVRFNVRWDSGSQFVNLDEESVTITGLTNEQEYFFTIESLGASNQVLSTSGCNVTPSASADPALLEVWEGSSEITSNWSNPTASGYTLSGASVDISTVTSNISITRNVGLSNKYVAIYVRNKVIKIDSIEYLDAGNNVVGFYGLDSNGEMGYANQSNLLWYNTMSNLNASDGVYFRMGIGSNNCSILGMRYDSLVNFTKIRINIIAD